jgi:lipopolysaccharide biosynthesis glycosyltransferase
LDRDDVRKRARAVVRRGIGKVGPLDKAVSARSEQRRRVDRLVAFYDRVREAYGPVRQRPAERQPDARPVLPPADEVDAVEERVLDAKAIADFVTVAINRGDLDPAVVGLVKQLLASGDIRRARSLAQLLRHREGMQSLGDICFALVVKHEPLYDEAWRIFRRTDTWHALRLASMEYFEVGFHVAPVVATDVLARALTPELPLQLPAHCWLQLAQWAFAVGDENVSARVADRAEHTLPAVRNAAERARLREKLDALRAWYGRRAAAAQPVAPESAEVRVALLDYQQAGRPAVEIQAADAENSLAALGHLARHRQVTFAGDDAPLASTLQARVPVDRAIDTAPATVRLVRVDRDASNFTVVPEGTWLLASGAFLEPIFDLGRDVPLNPCLRPLFVGFAVAPAVLHQAGVIEQLKRYAPVGCRDWRTVFLLQAAGVPAFFSGWVNATADLVSGDPRPDELAPADAYAQHLLAAADRLRALRGETITTRQIATYLAARSVGADVRFEPRQPNDGALQGIADITDVEFVALRTRIDELLARVFDAILGGVSDEQVYAVWRAACAPLVAEAEAERASLPAVAPPHFDVAAAVGQTQAASVVIERSAPAPNGAEIHVELSLDGNYKHQLDVVLDSIVTHASRPIRAYVLCRDHTRADFDRMARLFPTVSFVWLPTDKADYGPIANMLGHITVATMDRLLLPALVPDVDRIIHHDLDALCLADLAELYDVPMGNAPLAARDQRHPFSGSGYISMTRGLPRAESREKSREQMIRLSRRQPFDYRNFNAGVMVLNLAQMRADNFVRDYLPYVERFGFNDQGVLNIYAGGQYYDFGRQWNRYPRMELIDDAKILHWIGGTKPWHAAFIEGQEQWRAAEARVAELIRDRLG